MGDRHRAAALIRGSAALAACCMVAAGCASSFVRSGEERTAAPPPADHPVGRDVGVNVTEWGPATAAGSAADTTGGDALAGGPSEPAAAGQARGGEADDPFNQTVLVHPDSGLRLTFVVGDKLEFGPEEPIDLELTVENASPGTRWVDSNTKVHFALWQQGAEEPAWTDRSCFVGIDFEDTQTSAVELRPGDEVSFAHEYPDGGFQTQADRPDCRVAPGAYLAVGQVAWCPEDTLVPFEYQGRRSQTCDQTQVVVVVSAPLLVRIG